MMNLDVLDKVREELIREFPDALIKVEDMKGCHGIHLNIEVASAKFLGHSPIECHRLIYNSLASLMEDIHAIQIKTLPMGEE